MAPSERCGVAGAPRLAGEHRTNAPGRGPGAAPAAREWRRKPLKWRGLPTEVLATPRAEQQISRLSRKQAKALGTFLDELAAVGCRALAYRLSGPAPVDHLCIKHIGGPLRVVVAFETPQRAWVLLVGPHDDRDPVLNVYAELYRLLGIEPPPDAGRDKPPCCDETADLPPVLGDTLSEILDRAARLRRTRRSL